MDKAAEHAAGHGHATEVLLALFVVFVAAQIGAEIAGRWGMPAVVGEIAAGCAIGRRRSSTVDRPRGHEDERPAFAASRGPGMARGRDPSRGEGGFGPGGAGLDRPGRRAGTRRVRGRRVQAADRPARASLRARRDSRYSTSAFAAALNPAPGARWASEAIMPRRAITYLRTAKPTPGCCS